MEELQISAVYKRKAIWDPADELRKNSKILQSMWAEVAKEVGVDVNSAKNRWKNLRAYFMSQLRELDKPKTGSGGYTKTTSTWAFYNQLLFLRDVLTSLDDAREDSLVSTQTSELSDQTLADNDGFDANNFQDSSVSEVIVLSENDTGTNIMSVLAMADKPVASSDQPGTSKAKPTLNKDEGNSQAGKKVDFRTRRANINKRKLNAGTEGSIQSRSGEILDIERRKVELLERGISEDDNPDLLFFKSLLPYMQEFTPMQKLRLRSKIKNLILEEHEQMQPGSGGIRDCISNETGMMTPYHQSSQYYSPPSASSISADTVQYQTSSTQSPVPQPVYTNLTPMEFLQ